MCIRDSIKGVIDELDYFRIWRDENEEVDQDRAGNVAELINAARLYEDTFSESDSDERPSLQGFLELVSLTSEADSVDSSKGAVTLMTMHAAKGLEFPCVFIIGLENGLIPHERATRNGDPASFQEERRLLFVGVTRAMEELQLTRTRERTVHGQRRTTISSPFVGEMPELELVCDADDLPSVGLGAPETDDFLNQAKARYEAAQLAGGAKIMSAADLERSLQERSTAEEQEASAPTESPVDEQATNAPPSDAMARAALAAATARVSAPAAPPAVYPVGSHVRHPQYGRGTVIDASDGSNRATVTVLFEIDDREETFVAKHCPLNPVG